MDGVCNICRAETMHGGASVNAHNFYTQASIILAANSGHFECLNQLLKNGADVNSYKGATALCEASSGGHTECVALLIKAGADLNRTGETALMKAIQRKSLSCMKLLIGAGADVNKRDDCAFTPLCHSASIGYAAGLSLLLHANAKVNYGPSALGLNIIYMEHSARICIGKPKIKRTKGNEDDNQSDSEKFTQEVSMLLMAAGEMIPKEPIPVGFSLIPLPIPNHLLPDPDLKLCLKHLCREAIRTHLLNLDPHHHLFDRIPSLGLPLKMSRYLLFDIDLADTMDLR